MSTTLPSLRSCLLLSLLALLPILSLAQTNDVFTLTADSLQNGQSVELSKLNWKYAPGDDPAWAASQFDDRAWETLNGTAITLDSIPKSGWRGIGWFRLRLRVDPALANQPLALVMVHYGASEIYLDGKLVERFGTVGATPETEVAYNPNTQPFGIVLNGQSEHVLAMRHSCQAMRNLDGGWGRLLARQGIKPGLRSATNRTISYGAGFGIRLAELKQALAEQDFLQSRSGFAQMRVALFLAIGLLHLLLYWFYPRQRANLFFGLFACVAASFSLSLLALFASHLNVTWITAFFVAIMLAFNLSPALLLGFIYAAFAVRPSRWFWGWLLVGVLYVPFDLVFPAPGLRDVILTAINVFPVIEVVRVINRLVRMRTENVGIISAAILTYTLTVATLPLALIRIIPEAVFVAVVLNFTSIILTIAFSAFLARQFARTNLDLETQLAQVKQLSAAALEHEKVKAENERRARELEEARQLQLSMLPKNIPQLPHLEIAAYMKTATEVGGDYYDFHLGEDGTLTVAVGDATGHGLKAGTMVTAVKSLFDTLAYHPDIPHIFERLSRTLKRMNLRGLFMAMTMVKVNGQQLSVSIAGMPPVLIYRAASGEVEEIAIRGIPLGSLTNYSYKQQEAVISTGDVVVLMSDGLPERFNQQREMLDYAPIKQTFAEIAGLSPQEIIAQLINTGERWADGRPQDDDITFVVIKITESK